MNDNDRPFTAALMKLRDAGATYQDLQDRSLDVRSLTWFRAVIVSDTPWAVHPPTPETFCGLTRLLAVSTTTLRQWIAIEWYGSAQPTLPQDVLRLARRIESLNDPDRSLVDDLVARLHALTVQAEMDRNLRELDASIEALRQAVA